MDLRVQQALRRASLLYLTTYSRTGKSGTVPILFFFHNDGIYFCTKRQTLKVRRIQHTGKVTLHIGHPSGPQLECSAAFLDDAKGMREILYRAYRRRYPFRWLILGSRLRRAFDQGEELIVRLTPLPSETT